MSDLRPSRNSFSPTVDKQRLIDPRRIVTGRVYLHPELGPVLVRGGSYMRNNRVSNFWDFQVLESGELRSGYGHFYEASGEYSTATLSQDQWRQLLADLGPGDAADALRRQLGLD